jgi:nuclear transport factor 2 (NTF2) superfamily protein
LRAALGTDTVCLENLSCPVRRCRPSRSRPPSRKSAWPKTPGTDAIQRGWRWPIRSDSRWRNRSTFLQGRAEIEAFLTQKWQRELDYRLIKELWAFRGDRIAVRFAYEWHDATGQWFRSYGNENWAFDGEGLMHTRVASINDLPITEAERLYHWPAGRRPDDHAGLTALGL